MDITVVKLTKQIKAPKNTASDLVECNCNVIFVSWKCSSKSSHLQIRTTQIKPCVITMEESNRTTHERSFETDNKKPDRNPDFSFKIYKPRNHSMYQYFFSSH